MAVAVIRVYAGANGARALSNPSHTSTSSGIIYKTRLADNDDGPRRKSAAAHKTEARIADAADLSASASAFATSKTAAGDPWTRWVERHCEYRESVMLDAIGTTLGEFRAQARGHCEREVGALKRELELLRREFTVLREQVGLERELRDLRAEVEEARAEVPKLPAIAERLEERQARTQRELDETKKKIARARTDLSVTTFCVRELEKKMAAAKRKASAASVEVELETSTSRFVMRNIHPNAAAALREFAAQVIDARTGGAVQLFGPAAGTA
jgi:chromosome segregation ATPase